MERVFSGAAGLCAAIYTEPLKDHVTSRLLFGTVHLPDHMLAYASKESVLTQSHRGLSGTAGVVDIRMATIESTPLCYALASPINIYPVPSMGDLLHLITSPCGLVFVSVKSTSV